MRPATTGLHRPSLCSSVTIGYFPCLSDPLITSGRLNRSRIACSEPIPMNWPIVISLALIVIVPILLMLLFRKGRRSGKVVYQKNLVLFSPEERILHSVLSQAVGEEFEILGKIRVADIIQPKRGTSAGNARNSYQEIAGRQFTFVLCHKSDLSVGCAVYLDDRGHGSRKPTEHDGLLKALCESAQLPLVRIAASPFYEIAEIRETVLSAVREEPFSLPQLDGRKEPRISNIEGLDLE